MEGHWGEPDTTKKPQMLKRDFHQKKRKKFPADLTQDSKIRVGVTMRPADGFHGGGEGGEGDGKGKGKKSSTRAGKGGPAGEQVLCELGTQQIVFYDRVGVEKQRGERVFKALGERLRGT